MLNKSDVISELKNQLESKLKLLNKNLNSAIISRNSDTKSSAGDKFETSREMAQIEIHKLEIEIVKIQQFISDLLSKNSKLITTDKGVFFIAISFGKLVVNNTEVFCISNSAPIAQHLVNAEKLEVIEFSKLKYSILGIS